VGHSVFDRYALYGLAGEAVRTLAPHTEAQPEAILLQLLAAFGNILGPGPHCMVGATRHTLNLFVVLVGGVLWSEFCGRVLWSDGTGTLGKQRRRRIKRDLA
jgi:hypothetical protein